MIDLREMVFRIPNIIPTKKSKKWINFFEENIKLAHQEGSSKSDLNYEYEVDNFLALNLNDNYHKEKFKSITDEIFKYINIMTVNYESYLKTKISPKINKLHMQSSDHIRIMRYKVGEEIKDHLDIGYKNYRASCTLNLHSDYQGGEFKFFSGKHKISLKQGEGMIFPAEQVWIHGVEKVTKGTRYCVNCFLRQ